MRAFVLPSDWNMAEGPQITWLRDGRRRHLHHGPIDLIVEAWGAADECARAHAQAAARFQTLLGELAAELALLRRPVDETLPEPQGPVARRMAAACRPFVAALGGVFVTPMAAVAGAVADETLAALTRGRRLARAYVNDGGDIALHLAPGECLKAGVVGDIARPALDAVATIRAESGIRGIATSGRGGRSFSLGIADAVTALARDAATADVAATLIANAVDIDHPAIARVPARDLDPDSDLGERPVTQAVGPLDEDAIAAALDAGEARAQRLCEAGLVIGAVLVLGRRRRAVGPIPPRLQASGSQGG